MSTATQSNEQPGGGQRRRRIFLGTAGAVLLAGGVLWLGLRGREGEEAQDAPGGDAAITVVGGRPALPGRGAGLAALPVFAEPAGDLAVVQTQPSDGAEGVALGADETQIVVQFNHPVVPLLRAQDQANLPDPATIEPAIAGEGEWLNTSTWRFKPEEDLRPSADYSVRIAAGLEDFLGATLPEDVTVRFRTAAPAVVRTHPESNSRDAGASRPISVTFNQAMDRASAEAAFRLARAGEDAPLSGSFRWEGAEMAFQPDERLEPDGAYVARVAAGARSANGGAALPAEHGWEFSVAPRPALALTEPADGSEQTTYFRENNAVELTFNTPMNTESVSVTIQPTVTNQSIWFDSGERSAQVSGNWLASRAYTMTVLGSSESRSGDALGEDATLRFSVAPMEPSLFLKSTGRLSLFSAYEPQQVYVDAINQPEAAFELYGVGREDFLALALGDWYSNWETYRPPESQRRRAWVEDTRAPLDTGRRISTTLATTPDGLLEPGLYYLAVRGGEGVGAGENRMLFLASRTNLTLKTSHDEVLVWATDLESGRPVPNLPVAVHRDAGEPLASGVTDADGIFRAPYERGDDPWAELMALAEQDGRVVAAAGSRWQDGIEPYAFNIGYDAEPRPTFGNLYTDRPIYRPGQTVYYRAVLRDDDDAVYRLPEAETVHVSVRDPNYDEILSTDLVPTGFGTVQGAIQLSPAARLGQYQVELSVPEPLPPDLAAEVGPQEEPSRRHVAGASFTVAAYRKPEFEVTVATDKPEYSQGETIEVEVSTAYYFGGGVADAEVHWRLISDDFFFQPEAEGWWDFIDYDLREERYYDAQGEVASEGEGKTDAEGRFRFEIPADLSEHPLSQVFTIDVEVTDINHQVVAGRASAVVHKGDFYIGLRPQAYLVEEGEAAGFDILALDHAGQPVPDQALDLAFYQRNWYSVKEKREDGAFYWTSAYTDTLVAESQARTDAQGAATAAFTPETGGTHRLVATAKDARGNEVRSATYQWVTSGDFVNWRQENNDRIDLVADKKSYAVGDTAEVLVPAPFAGAEALVTIERGGFRDVQRMRLEGNSETLQIPIREDFVPNVYVSVVLVKGVGPDSPVPQLKLGYTNLPVSSDTKLLDIDVRPDKETAYHPRETVKYAISVKDQAGAPVRAELSTALVDKALLALTDDSSTSLVDAFYGQRMLGVSTGASLTELANRLNQELAAEKKGGGGGEAEGGGTVRRIFRDTAYWNGSVLTDEAGEAEISVELPDNLTTWNLNVRGVTGADTLIGTASNDILSTREVLARPVTPRFLVVGDTVQLETVVNNQSAEDLSLNVSLAATGLTLPEATSQPMELPAGGKAAVVWQVGVPAEGLNPPAVPGAFGEVTVQMTAQGGDYTDGVELRLPVYQFSEPQVVATAGQVDSDESQVTERIQLPEAVDGSQGGLEVKVSPSLAAAMIDSLDWLESFPYDCVEQTVGKFLPNTATYLAIESLDLDDAERELLRQNLETQIAVELQRLYGFQNHDGGWGWWHDDSRPWLTAYALYGLTLAERAGFAVSPSVVERAVAFLEQSLVRPVDAEAAWDLNERALVTWALSERGGMPVSRAVTLYERRAGMDLFAKALLALALSNAGGPEQQGRVDGLLADLGGAAKLSATGAHWEEAALDHATMSTDTRSTAMILYALARLDSGNTNIPGAVRWLMANRSEDHWRTTQETTWSILGLTEAMRASGELDARYDWHAELNEAELGQGTVAAENITETVRLAAPMADLRPGEGNDLVLRKDGLGPLYYAAHLRLYQPIEAQEPLNRGILLGRQYFKVDPGTFEATGEAVDTAAIGDIVQVKLTLVAEEPLHYVSVEDPIPAGFEIIDSSLKTTSAAAQAPEMVQVEEEGSEADEPRGWWERDWWSNWVDSQLLDHKVALFSSQLDPGTYEYTYLIRAGVAGNYHVIPAHAEQMYFPEVFGRSAGGVFTVTPE